MVVVLVTVSRHKSIVHGGSVRISNYKMACTWVPKPLIQLANDAE